MEKYPWSPSSRINPKIGRENLRVVIHHRGCVWIDRTNRWPEEACFQSKSGIDRTAGNQLHLAPGWTRFEPVGSARISLYGRP